MLCALLFVAATIAQDVPTLRHAERQSFAIGRNHAVLEGIGPSRTFRYELEGEDSTLFVWAASEQANLVLHAQLEGEAKPSEAAALLAGKKRSPGNIADDDSGGGTTPFLRLERKGGGKLEFSIAVKALDAPVTETPITVHCFEAKETDATRSAAAESERAIEESRILARAGESQQSRDKLAKCLSAILSVEDLARSEVLHQAAWKLGLASYRGEDLKTCRKAWAQVLAFYQATRPDAHPSLLTVRQNLGAVLGRLGDHAGARSEFEKVLEARSRFRPDDHIDVQVARLNLANCLVDLGELPRARALQQRVLHSFMQALPPDHPHTQAARVNLARTLATLGELEEARELEEQVVEVYTRTLQPEHPDLLTAQGNLALTRRNLGDRRGARELFQAILETRSRTLPEGHPDLQKARVNLASEDLALGDLSGALRLYQDVMKNYEHTLPEDHLAIQGIRLHLAATLRSLGDLQAARALQESAFEAYTRKLPKDHPDLQATRAGLAATLFILGDLPGARALQEAVLGHYSSSLPPAHPHLQSARSNLAATLIRLGLTNEARALLERALEVQSGVLESESLELQKVRSNLAIVDRALGDLDSARTLQEQVLSILDRALPEEHFDLQSAQSNLALTLWRLGEVVAASDLLEQVLEVRSRRLSHDHPLLQKARGNVARLSVAQQRRERSRALIGDIAESLLDEQAVLRRALERVSIDKWVLDTVLSIASGAGAFESDASTELLAFALSELDRASFLTEARLRRSWASHDEANALHERLAQVGWDLSETLRSVAAQELFSELVQERSRLRSQILDLASSSAADLNVPRVDFGSIQAQLGAGEVAIGFCRYERWQIDPMDRTTSTTPSYLAWLIERDHPLQRIELGSVSKIDAAIGDLQQAIQVDSGSRTPGVTRLNSGETTKTLDVSSGSRRVSQLILEPILERITDARRLWVAPAGTLHLIPIDALPVGQEQLGDRLEVVMLSALSELTFESSAELAKPQLLAIGGIDYDQARFDTNQDDSIQRALQGAGNDGNSRMGQRSGLGKFSPLQGAAEEVLEICDVFNVSAPGSSKQVKTRAILLSGAEATRDAFGGLAPRSRFLHLATHGWFAPESVASRAEPTVIDSEASLEGSSFRDQVIGLAPYLLCGLAFAGANSDANAFGRVRGIMTAEEISLMDLTGVELCVLSACQTNVGALRDGQGIASLQSALHAAGVRTAITSLWKVPDQATRELMTEFYRRLWVLKQPKAKALWNAKKKLREQLDGEGKPIYTIRDWAGWVLSGDPD